MRRVALGILAAILALALTAALLGLFGVSPGMFATVGFRGAFGSAHAFSETLLKSIPLLFTALAVVIAFRAGIWNIGGEGQFLIGAIGALVASRFIPVGGFGTLAALATGALCGALWAMMAQWLEAHRGAPVVLTTILLNFVAVHLIGYVVNGPLQESSGHYPQSDRIPSGLTLHSLGDTRLHAGLLLGIASAALLYVFLYRSQRGLRIRAVGFNPIAAAWAGIDVGRERLFAMALSGGLAGAGGAVELLGVTHRLFERFAAGYGYAGIAVALLGHLHPIAAIASAILFGGLSTAAGELQRSADVSSSLATLAQGLAIIALLAVASPAWKRLLTRVSQYVDHHPPSDREMSR